jgi:hypothetical protein
VGLDGPVSGLRNVGGDDGRHDGSVGHPMLLTFATIARSRRAKGRAFVALWVYVDRRAQRVRAIGEDHSERTLGGQAFRTRPDGLRCLDSSFGWNLVFGLLFTSSARACDISRDTSIDVVQTVVAASPADIARAHDAENFDTLIRAFQVFVPQV